MGEKKELTFEEKLKRLEDIVAAIEKGDLGLEETLAKVAEGKKLSGELTATIAAAEKRLGEYQVLEEDKVED